MFFLSLLLTTQAGFQEVYRYVEGREWKELPGYLDVKELVIYADYKMKIYSFKISFHESIPDHLGVCIEMIIDRDSDGNVDYTVHGAYLSRNRYGIYLYEGIFRKQIAKLQGLRQLNFITLILPFKYYNHSISTLQIGTCLYFNYKVLTLPNIKLDTIKFSPSWTIVFSGGKIPFSFKWAEIRKALISRVNDTLKIKLILGDAPPTLPPLNKSKYISVQWTLGIDADGNLSTGYQWRSIRGADYLIYFKLTTDRGGKPVFRADIREVTKVQGSTTYLTNVYNMVGTINGSELIVKIPISIINTKPSTTLIPNDYVWFYFSEGLPQVRPLEE